MHRISVSSSQLSPKLCLFGPTNLWSSPATCKHWSIPGKADVAEAELGCELDSKRETSHLAQCGKSLSSNKLQAKQLLKFFLSLYWFFAFKNRKKDSQTQSSWKHWRVQPQCGQDLHECLHRALPMHFCPGPCLLFQPLASPRQTPPSQEELRCVIRWFGAVDPCLQKTLCLPSAQPEAVLPTGLPEAESGARLSVTNRERKWWRRAVFTPLTKIHPVARILPGSSRGCSAF